MRNHPIIVQKYGGVSPLSQPFRCSFVSMRAGKGLTRSMGLTYPAVPLHLR
jgi:hypothetical protein